MRKFLITPILITGFCSLCCRPGLSADGLILNSEAIALSAQQIAEKTRTTGWCYAAVSKALNPLGVTLRGAAAYEAEEQLRKDGRFVPLIIFSVDELKRGDIIVYSKSQSHPYGHIAVYEGNYKEASDHLAPITHTKNYGGAIVFRLADEYQSGLGAGQGAAARAVYKPQVQSSAPSGKREVLKRHPVLRQILRSIVNQFI